MRDDVARALAARALEVAQKTKSQQGPKGEKGDAGQIIVQPNKGDKGDTGPMGPQGIPGKSITGPKGDKGDKGDTGQKGDIGQKGDAGNKGDKGERGERGFQGLRGSDGSKGDIGPMPKHEKKGLMIRFEKEPGTWGEWIIMPTSGGGGGGRDDKLTDRQAELVALAEFYKTRGSNANKYIKTDGTTLTWDTLDGSDINLASPPAIGGTAPNTGSFTTLNSTSGALNGTIGATTPSTVNATTITGQTGVLSGTGQNFFRNSQNYASIWGSTNSLITSNATTAPDSTNTASKLIATTANAQHLIFQTLFTFTFPFTTSVYAKASEYNWLSISCDIGGANGFAWFNLSTGVLGTVNGNFSATITPAGNGWYRCTFTRNIFTSGSGGVAFSVATGDNVVSFAGDNTSGIFIWGAQLELGSTANTYIPTTTTAVYGTPTLSFSGVSSIGLLSTGALYLQPAGTGALQAQATTSTTAGGNVRGTNAVDFQMVRDTAARVASGSQAFIGAGRRNTASGEDSFVGGGFQNTASNSQAAVVNGARNIASGGTSFIGAGFDNTANITYSTVVNGQTNTASGYFGFVGNGFTNSTTSSSAVTTQATTSFTSGSTAVTLSGSNANIKVGQIITGTGITFPNTYVAAISGTSLTLSQNAVATGTPTLSFFTPHGVVVGGGNNQATGSYSFIGGGGDAGTAANRNVASGDWSFVGGGRGNTASGNGSVVCGGGLDATTTYANVASGLASTVAGGLGHLANSAGSTVLGGFFGTANGVMSTVVGGRNSTARAISGNTVFSASSVPISGAANGFNQAALLILARQTTDATPTALASDSSAAGTTNQVILPNNSAYLFKATVISNVTGGGNTSAWKLEGAIKRGANAASTAIVGSVTTTLLAQDAGASGWVIAATADTTNGGLRITFTGQASTTIRTVCKVETTEVTF
jgi:hypothetical protein